MAMKLRIAATFSKIMVVLFSLRELLQPVAGEKYAVGANFVPGALWTNELGSSNGNETLFEKYESWAKSVNISVGDTLQFYYDDSHTVVLVETREMYDSCSYANFEDVTSPKPPTSYIVNSTRPLYFVCSVDRHCQEGQKVAITNIAAAATGATPPSLQIPSPAPNSSDGGSPSFRSRLTESIAMLFICLLIS